MHTSAAFHHKPVCRCVLQRRQRENWPSSTEPASYCQNLPKTTSDTRITALENQFRFAATAKDFVWNRLLISLIAMIGLLLQPVQCEKPLLKQCSLPFINMVSYYDWFFTTGSIRLCTLRDYTTCVRLWDGECYHYYIIGNLFQWIKSLVRSTNRLPL